jgi:NAD(P)-dependent dehydrogenase (short-subunit alcohol dehydrogenase family)
MLEGKICLVTGSGGGIGRAAAVEMARRGAAAVVISDVDDAAGEQTLSMIRDAGGEGAYVRCDVEEPTQIKALVDQTARLFGGLDVLHNNAGVQESYYTDKLTVDTLPEEVWEKVYRINLRAIWLGTKYAAPYLRRSERGPAIVNAASVGGLTGFPQCPIYGPTKAAIIQLTKNTAMDMAPIRCNCYSPGTTRTAMIERFADAAEDKVALERTLIATHLIPRLGEPVDIANLVCFLASDEASFITGAEFTIDAGAMAWRGANA